MIINMAEGATEAEIQHVVDNIVLCGYQPHVIRGTERTIVAAVGSGGNRTLLEALQSASGNSAGWQFSLARMSSRKEVVRLDDREIWTVENFYSLPTEARKTGAYMESRLGPLDPDIRGPSAK